MASEYLRTKTISQRIGGVVVTVLETGDVQTVQLTKGDKQIEVFTESIAEIAKSVRAMVAILESDE